MVKSAFTIFTLIVCVSSTGNAFRLPFDSFKGCLRPSTQRTHQIFLHESVVNKNDFSIAKEEKRDFNWEKQWYPLAVLEFLDKSEHHSMHLLGSELNVFFKNNQWEVSSSRNQGLLFPTIEEQGLLWCWGEHSGKNGLENSKSKKPRLLEELYDHAINSTRIELFFYDIRDLPYGWDYFMENTLDPSHVVVSHHGGAGNRYLDPKCLNMRQEASYSEIPYAEGGDFNENFPEDKGLNFKVDPINNRFDSHSISDFRPPCLNKIENVKTNGAKFILGLYCTPTKPGYCRHIGATIIMSPEKGKKQKSGVKSMGKIATPKIPNWMVHLVSSAFIHQDMVFIHHQEKKSFKETGYFFSSHENSQSNDTTSLNRYLNFKFTPNKEDLGVLSLRKWINKKANGGPKWGKIDEEDYKRVWRKKDLFNVYETHTKFCKCCQGAAKNLKILQKLFFLLSFYLLVSWQTNGIQLKGKKLLRYVKPALGLVSGILGFLLNKLINLFYYYEYSHQDNN